MSHLFVLVLTMAVGYASAFVGIASATEGDTDMPVPRPSVSFQSDPFTGALTGSIPIEVPPGRNGMQPNLTVSYWSGGGNGWLGVGWKLEMGTIERQTRWGVLYNPTSAEEQAGKVYMFHLNGVSADLVPAPAPAPSNQYQMKIEGSFFRVLKLAGGGWEVTDKRGTKYFFGTTSQARIADPGDAAKVFKWWLERVEDRDGNYMTVSYVGDQGQGYLSQINYAGNGATAPTNTVKFYLEDRPDAADMYTSNFRVKTAKRLKSIEVKANGSLVRAYKATYSTSLATATSLLTALQQYGKDATIDVAGTITGGSALPATTLGYRTDASLTSFTDGTVWMNGWCPSGTAYGTADFNGDGKQDLWCNFLGPQGFPYMGKALSNGAGGFSDGGNWTSAGIPCIAKSPADLNADGKQDAWCPIENINYAEGGATGGMMWMTSLSNQWGQWWLNLDMYDPTYPLNPMRTGIADFNGDGKGDLWYINGSTMYYYFSTGAAFSYAGNAAGICSSNSLGSADFDGDGRADLWCHSGGTTTTWLSTGTSFVAGPSLANFCASGEFGVSEFNGDGKPDLYCHPSDGTVQIAILAGQAFAGPTTWLNNWCATGSFGLGDFNGDGKQDLWCYVSAGGTVQVALATGSSFTAPGTWMNNLLCPTTQYDGFGNPYDIPGVVGTGDITGDGKTDLYCVSYGGQVKVARSGSAAGPLDLLATISNGLGGSTTISYAPSTTYTNTQLPFPLQTVAATTTNDGNGNGSTSTYGYSGGYFYVAEKDFRGFSYSAVTSPAGSNGAQSVTEEWFHQGNDLAVDANNPNVPSGFTKGLPYRTKISKVGSPAVPLTEKTTTYTADLDNVAPWFTPPAVVTTSIYNNAGGVAKQTQTEAASYDSYGNLTLVYNRGDFTGNNALTSDDTTTVLTYAPADTTNWLIGFPTVTTMRAGLGTGGAILSQTTTSYDGTGVGACTAAPSGSATVTKGHVTKVERLLNPGGTQVTSGMEYDPQTGVLLCTRDPNGNKTTLTYDSTKTFPLTSTNALGHVTTTSYYGVNGVASDTGLYGQLKGITDPNSRTSTNTYDALGRRLTTTASDGFINTMVYNYGGAFVVGTQHVQSTMSGGGLSVNLVSKTYFDGLGRTTKTEQPGAADGGANLKVLVTETQYDVRGLTAKTSLPYIQNGSDTATSLGLWRTLTYDALGRLTKTANPDNTSSTVCYNAWTTTAIDPKLHKKVETKDALGRLVTVQEYTGTGSATDCSGGTLYATTSYSYDRLGNLLGVTDAKGNVSSMTYDTLGRKLTMHDPDMGDWSYTYDANGNLLTQVDAKNQKLCLSYDALNRRTQKNYGTTTVACGTNTIVYAYDDTVAANNGKGRLKQVSDPAQSVTFQYDSRGRISQTAKTLDGSTYITTSAYDGLGRLTTVSYPTSPIKTVTYTYDGPQLKSVQEGATTYVTYGGWNALGKPATSIFGNGVVTTHTYANTANATCTQQTFRLCTLKTTGPSIGGGASGTLTFIPEADTSLRSDEPDTALGNLDHVVIDTSPMREAYLRFNITGLPSGATITSASLTLVNGGYATPESNDGGAIFKFAPTDPAWAESVPTWNTRAGLTGIDASGLLSKVGAVNPGASYTFTNLQSAISGNGRVTFVIRPQSADGAGYFTKEATVAGQRPVLTVHYTTSSSPGASYQDLRYVFEANGNVGDIYDATVAANAGDQHFSYDDLDRLTLANGPYGASGINATLAYSYDQIGNMIVNPQVGAYSYPASGLSSVRPHAVSVAGPYPISYDNNGNVVTMTDPTGFFGYSASYNTENRLSSLTTTYGGVPTTATFVYDGDGGRVKKIDGVTTTRYISKLYECDNSNCSRFIWAGSTRIATIAVNTGAVQYWHGDHLGSSSVITDSTGAKVQALAYFPYGDLRTNQSFTTPAINVPYKYTGKELDASSNLHFYEARYYHAVFGRFVSPDTIVPNLRDPQNLNRYSYVRNNPLRYTDPTGHCTEDDGNQSFCNNGQPVNQAQDTFVLPDIKVTAQREAFTSGHTSLGNGNTYSLSYLYSWGSAFSPSTFGVFPVGNASPNITVPPQVTINNAIDVIAQTNFGKTVRPKLVQRLRDLNKAHRIVPSYQVNPNEKGFYSNGTIFIDPSLLTTNLVELPGVLAHEAVHAGQKEGLTHQERVDNEIEAFNTEYTLETELHDGAFKDFYRTLVPRDMTREQIEKLYP